MHCKKNTSSQTRIENQMNARNDIWHVNEKLAIIQPDSLFARKLPIYYDDDGSGTSTRTVPWHLMSFVWLIVFFAASKAQNNDNPFASYIIHNAAQTETHTHNFKHTNNYKHTHVDSFGEFRLSCTSNACVWFIIQQRWKQRRKQNECDVMESKTLFLAHEWMSMQWQKAMILLPWCFSITGKLSEWWMCLCSQM